MDQDFVIANKKFKVRKINALKQFHIVRRIAPILAELAPNLSKLNKAKDFENSSEETKLEAIGNFIGPIMSGMSKLSDKDSELVLIGLLEAVEVHQEEYGNWAPVAKGGQIVFDDLALPVLMQAAGRAFMFNLSGFFTVLPQVS